MYVPSEDVPQANSLDDVIRTVEAVQAGASTSQTIALSIGKVERQGRYYRRAAEILGLINTTRNHSSVSELGRQLLNATAADREQLLRDRILNTAIFQRVLPLFERHPDGLTQAQLSNFMSEVTEEAGPTMMPRRVSTVISWLERIGLIIRNEDRLVLTGTSSLPLLDYQDIAEPLLPNRFDLREYETVAERSRHAQLFILLTRDEEQNERANNAHIRLVNKVAAQLHRAGAIPRYNSYVDLAAQIGERSFLFEMKSLTTDNARVQLRRGLSQLYEYQYLQDAPEAILVLVIEQGLPEPLEWMQEYLERHRGVCLVWSDNEGFNASHATRELLSFLWL